MVVQNGVMLGIFTDGDLRRKLQVCVWGGGGGEWGTAPFFFFFLRWWGGWGTVDVMRHHLACHCRQLRALALPGEPLTHRTTLPNPRLLRRS
jgi:hypothetical protein